MGNCFPKQKKGERSGRDSAADEGKRTKPYKKGVIPPKLRAQVWEHGDGRCYVCGEKVTTGWHCSHVVAEVKGGPTTLSNLRVCCPHCNLSMGDLNLYRYIEIQIAKGTHLTGQGVNHYQSYLKKNPAARSDTRTNNWGSEANKGAQRTRN